jgi:hypothetical protein
MKDEIRKLFPENEQTYYDENKKLLDEWKTYIQDKKIVHKDGANGFVPDGFFPYYYKQKIKILYIAVESRQLSGCNYIDMVYRGFKNNKIGQKGINGSVFFRKLLKITYGIENDFLDWNKIPKASEITQKYLGENGISFAIMELSKLSNDNPSRHKNIKQINNFIAISKNESRNFWNEQIKILNPHYIISMNLVGHLHELGDITDKQKNDTPPSIYSLSLGGNKSVKIIDTYHFSNSVEEKWFYESIVEIIKSDKKSLFPQKR